MPALQSNRMSSAGKRQKEAMLKDILMRSLDMVNQKKRGASSKKLWKVFNKAMKKPSTPSCRSEGHAASAALHYQVPVERGKGKPGVRSAPGYISGLSQTAGKRPQGSMNFRRKGFVGQMLDAAKWLCLVWHR